MGRQQKGLPVVDLAPEISRRKRQARYDCTLIVEHLDRPAADIEPDGKIQDV